MVITNAIRDFSGIQFKEGTLILVNKPLDWTSFDVVNKIRYSLKFAEGKMKVGHAGTLDPRATGLLIVCTGKFTKQIERFQGMDKVYSGSMYVGASTPSFDTETEEDCRFPIDHISDDVIDKVIKNFSGEIDQVPPIYSALKKEGVPYYKMAREGQKIVPDSRKVHIHRFIIQKSELPELYFEVECSKGTYIRSLVHDFGQALGAGAYLKTLVRDKIGDYSLDDAFEVQDLVANIDLINNATPN